MFVCSVLVCVVSDVGEGVGVGGRWLGEKERKQASLAGLRAELAVLAHAHAVKAKMI